MSEPSASSALNTSSAVMWRVLACWKISRIFRRGKVALSPLLFSSSTCVMASHPSTTTLESADHSQRRLQRLSMRPALLALPIVSLVCAALAGCESLQRTDSFMGFITPYRIDIVQGNAITKEQAAQIKPGLSRLQVRDILG